MLPPMTTDARYRAWDAIHDNLPDGWQVGLASYDPGRRAWTGGGPLATAASLCASFRKTKAGRPSDGSRTD